MMMNYEPLPNQPIEFVPNEDVIQRATSLRKEFIQNAEAIDVIFERQVRILYEVHQDWRLCEALGYDSVWEFLQDPEIQDAMRIKVNSSSQLYRLLRLAKVDELFPGLNILREPRLAKLTHTAVLPRLLALNPSQVQQAEEIIEEVRNSTIQKLDSAPLRDVRIDNTIVKLDGIPVLKMNRLTILAVRALSKLAHLSPAPRFEIRGKEVVAYHNNDAETVGTLTTTDEDAIEFIRDRLQAIRK